MKHKAKIARLEARRKDYENTMSKNQKYQGMYHRPGSLNK